MSVYVYVYVCEVQKTSNKIILKDEKKFEIK